MLATARTTGEKLRRFRRGKGMTQVQLARAAGLHDTTITYIETGQHKNPHPSTLAKLADVLDVTPLDLLDD